MEEQSNQSDLMQRWENGPGYIFLETPDEQKEVAVYLKDREAEGLKSVHFYFPNHVAGACCGAIRSQSRR
jgi:hypothetical protein